MQRTILFACIQAKKNKEDATDAVNLFPPSEVAVAMLVHPHQSPEAEQAQKPGEELRHIDGGIPEMSTLRRRRRQLRRQPATKGAADQLLGPD